MHSHTHRRGAAVESPALARNSLSSFRILVAIALGEYDPGLRDASELRFVGRSDASASPPLGRAASVLGGCPAARPTSHQTTALYGSIGKIKPLFTQSPPARVRPPPATRRPLVPTPSWPTSAAGQPWRESAGHPARAAGPGQDGGRAASAAGTARGGLRGNGLCHRWAPPCRPCRPRPLRGRSPAHQRAVAAAFGPAQASRVMGRRRRWGCGGTDSNAMSPPALPDDPLRGPRTGKTPGPSASRLLSRLSRRRIAAPRLAAIDCGVLPPRAGGAPSAARKQRPPVKAGGGSDRAKKWLCLSYPRPLHSVNQQVRSS